MLCQEEEFWGGTRKLLDCHRNPADIHFISLMTIIIIVIIVIIIVITIIIIIIFTIILMCIAIPCTPVSLQIRLLKSVWWWSAYLTWHASATHSTRIFAPQEPNGLKSEPGHLCKRPRFLSLFRHISSHLRKSKTNATDVVKSSNLETFPLELFLPQMQISVVTATLPDFPSQDFDKARECFDWMASCIYLPHCKTAQEDFARIYKSVRNLGCSPITLSTESSRLWAIVAKCNENIFFPPKLPLLAKKSPTTLISFTFH